MASILSRPQCVKAIMPMVVGSTSRLFVIWPIFMWVCRVSREMWTRLCPLSFVVVISLWDLCEQHIFHIWRIGLSRLPPMPMPLSRKSRINLPVCVSNLNKQQRANGVHVSRDLLYSHTLTIESHHNITHLTLVSHICVSESGQHWFRQWLVAYSVPSHHLKQCWVSANLPIGTNFSEIWVKMKIFSFTKNVSESIVHEMAAILSRGRWVNTAW